MVCLHPSAPDSYNDYIQKIFYVYRDSTSRIGKNAEILVTHDSLSVSYGIMLGKPII